jgi:RES domain-containing protein
MWLRPTLPGHGQQAFGRALLEQHLFVLIPSAVSGHGWNLLFNPNRAGGHYRLSAQEPFAR